MKVKVQMAKRRKENFGNVVIGLVMRNVNIEEEYVEIGNKKKNLSSLKMGKHNENVYNEYQISVQKLARYNFFFSIRLRMTRVEQNLLLSMSLILWIEVSREFFFSFPFSFFPIFFFTAYIHEI